MTPAVLQSNLIDAVYRNDLPRVKEYLAEGADINGRDNSGWAALSRDGLSWHKLNVL